MTKADIMKQHGIVMLMPPEELYRELTDQEAEDFIKSTVMIIQCFRESFPDDDSQYEGID